MSHIDDLLADLCPEGVNHRSLGDVGEFIRGNGLQKSDLTSQGVPAIHYGQIHTHYGVWADSTKSFTSPELAAKLRRARPGDLIVVTTSEDDSAVAKATAWIGNTEVAVSGDAYIYRHTLYPLYVSYFFQSEQFQTQKKRHISGTKVRRISGASLAKIIIPVPPLVVQREIVRILDQFAQLEAELEAELVAELEARRNQYEHYRGELLTVPEKSGAVWSTLGAISTRVSSGATPRAGSLDYYQNGTIPWLRTQEVRFTDIWDTDIRITEKALHDTATKWIPANCVIVAISGATAGRSAVNRIPLTTNQHCCNFEIDPTQANYRYVFYWVRSQYEQIKALGQGARSDLNASIIRNVKIPIPPLDEQVRIVEVLDKFDAVFTDISVSLSEELAARRKQFEYYRDQLLTFKDAAA